MLSNFTTFLTAHPWILIAAAAWTIPWKGVALWRAARRRSYVWFVVLLVVNTLGILEILYIFKFSKRKQPTQEYGPNGRNNHIEKKILDIKR